MRTLLLISWLLVALAGIAWHYGPGQDWMKFDEVALATAQANEHAANGKWAKVVAKFDEAIRSLPEGQVADARMLRLQRAKAQMLARQLPEAHADLQNLVDDMKSDPKANQKVLAEAQSAHANSQYYMTWLMRLEGQPREIWEPEIEGARQTYRMLAERAEAAGDTAQALQNKEDLESAIRLARMDLGELQGLPLPSQ
jgi:hypothetical protein